MKIKKMWLFYILLVFLLSGCSPAKVNTQTASPVPTQTQAIQTEVPQQTQKTSELQEKTYEKNEEAQLSGIKMELLSVEEKEATDIFSKGKKLVLCRFKVENGTSSEVVIDSIKSFEGFCDGMAVLTEEGKEVADIKLLNGTLKPNASVEGNVVFKLPEDWKDLQITYVPTGMPGNKLVFQYKK